MMDRGPVAASSANHQPSVNSNERNLKLKSARVRCGEAIALNETLSIPYNRGVGTEKKHDTPEALTFRPQSLIGKMRKRPSGRDCGGFG